MNIMNMNVIILVSHQAERMVQYMVAQRSQILFLSGENNILQMSAVSEKNIVFTKIR